MACLARIYPRLKPLPCAPSPLQLFRAACPTEQAATVRLPAQQCWFFVHEALHIIHCPVGCWAWVQRLSLYAVLKQIMTLPTQQAEKICYLNWCSARPHGKACYKCGWVSLIFLIISTMLINCMLCQCVCCTQHHTMCLQSGGDNFGAHACSLCSSLVFSCSHSSSMSSHRSPASTSA